MKLDVGCGMKKRNGFIGIDTFRSGKADIIHDLTLFPWPIPNDTCTEIVLDNVLEHLPNTVGTFNELHRIAKAGCRVEIIYPYWRSFGCYADPTHVRYFNEYMIEYFLRPGTSTRSENKYAFYTNQYWKLVSRELTTYPILSFMPSTILSFLSRHFIDIVHSVRIVVTPEKLYPKS